MLLLNNQKSFEKESGMSDSKAVLIQADAFWMFESFLKFKLK